MDMRSPQPPQTPITPQQLIEFLREQEAQRRSQPPANNGNGSQSPTIDQLIEQQKQVVFNLQQQVATNPSLAGTLNTAIKNLVSLHNLK